jgi:hypothetical protein
LVAITNDVNSRTVDGAKASEDKEFSLKSRSAVAEQG